MKLIKSTFLLFFITIASVQASEERRKRQAYGAGGYNDGYNGAAPYRPPQQQYQQQQPAPYKPQPPPKQYSQGEEEKNEGPHPLQKLLENSKFECGSKKDGYYADGDVGCQAFHYCVSGQKHSMMCPAGTVFHQVHLNCVPSDQDICAKADKFYFVNDYLNKPLEQKGPNNTVQYHQRYYPEGYAVGDPFVPPQQSQGQGQARPQQAYAPQPQAYQPQPQAYQPKPAAYAPPPANVYRQPPPPPPQQNYPRAQPSAPFAPQQAVYRPPPQQAPAPVVYQPQPQAIDPYNRPSLPQSAEQSQALQAHKAAEAAVLAQHYKAQQQQAQYQQQQQQQAGAYQPQQYGYGGYRDQYRPQY